MVLVVPSLAQNEDAELPASATPTPTQITFKESDHEVVYLSVAYADNFDDAAVGIFPEATLDPLALARRYEDGEYVLQKLDPRSTQIATVDVPGIYDDATIALDVRLVGETFGRSIAIGCRRQADSSHYRLSVFPDTNEFLLARWDGSVRSTLAGETTSAMNGVNESDHVELGCVEETIWVVINGQVVASVDDATYHQGRMWIGVYGSAVSADARFDNLVIRRMETVERPLPPLEPTATPEPVETALPTWTPTPTPAPTSTAPPTATDIPSPTATPSIGGVETTPSPNRNPRGVL